MICIPGVGCIPTEVLLGALLVVLKPIYDYIMKLFGKETITNSKKEANSAPTGATAVLESFDNTNSPYVLKIEDSFKLRLEITKKVVFLRFTQSACKPWYAIITTIAYSPIIMLIKLFFSTVKRWNHFIII